MARCTGGLQLGDRWGELHRPGEADRQDVGGLPVRVQFQVVELAPVVARARELVCDGEPLVPVQSEDREVECRRPDLGAVAGEVDHDQDGVRRPGVGLREADQVRVVDRVEVQRAQLLQRGVCPAHLVELPEVARQAPSGGLGAGPLLAGVLAQYAPLPLMLCFIVDLGLVVVAAVAVQAVAEPVRRASTLRLRPQKVNVPIDIRGVFTRSAIAGFAGFAVLGLFTAVSPAFVGTVLHDTNHAITGAVVLSLFIASIIGQSLSSRIGERRALLIGCASLIVGMIFVGISLPVRSLALLIVGAVIAGLPQGMSFRSGL